MASLFHSVASLGTQLSVLMFPQAANATLLAEPSFNVSQFAEAVAGAGLGDGSGPSALPQGMLDSLLVNAGQVSPLMQIVYFFYRQLGARLGLDPSLLLTLLASFWGVSRLSSQLFSYLHELVTRYLTCALTVSEYDIIHAHLMKWLSMQQSIRTNRFLHAQTIWQSAWDEEDDDDDNGAGHSVPQGLSWTDGDDGEGEARYINFSNLAAQSNPRFVPAMGLTSFWHNGTYFRVYRRKETVMDTMSWRPLKDQEELQIACYGRSTEPIKRLFAEAKAAYYHDTARKTTIYRPKPKEMRRDSSMWQQVARRPVRPMRTVVLDGHEKRSVLADVNEYLHPSTPRWYASRGIPLRRGYLFHGPPGTGKTSFSFALAGVFGIDIYVISLQDFNITEEDLAALFTRLPRRCIVLLEDIDSAGLRRDPSSEEQGKEKPGAHEKQDESKKPGETDGSTQHSTNGINGNASPVVDDGKVEEGAEKGSKESKESSKVEQDKGKKKKGNRSKKRDVVSTSESDDQSSESEQEHSARNRRKGRKRFGSKKGKKKDPADGISLSGLLNAIDGVASHEGRILIMTTNKPESLDDALVRPGRVDVQVAFANASSEQATELFLRMYETSQPVRKVKKPSHGPLSSLTSPSSSPPPPPPGAAGAKEGVEAVEQAWDLSPQISESAAEIERLAEAFGTRIPEQAFSPAEIQGFLLKRKRSPRKALDEVEAWVEATLKQREAKSKVITVQ